MLIGSRQSPWSLPPFRVTLEPRPLPSAGITPLPRYYGPLRHPAGPNWPSRVFGWRVRATDRASRVAPTLLLHACCRQYPGGDDRPVSFAPTGGTGRWQPSPIQRRVGLRIIFFEACSAFTRVAACVLAEPPKAVRFTEVLQSVSLPPRPAPIATGWNEQVAGRDSHPLERSALARRTL